MATTKAVKKPHPFMKLGKLPAKRDARNFKLAAVLKPAAALPLPDQWDFDLDIAKTAIPLPPFLNDKIGDCVIAARGHATLRFEYFEQNGAILGIKDAQILREYKREGGSLEEGKQGLIILDSLKWWQQKGWRAYDRTYKIHAFAELDRSTDAVKTAIRYLNGAYIGLALPNSWQEQLDRGQPWSLVPGPDGKPNPHNGHCVYLCGYNQVGPVCVTWGQKQSMTWEFFNAICDEAYAIVDDRDKFLKKNSPIDVVALDKLLAGI